MLSALANFIPVIPEMVVLFAALLILMIGVFLRKYSQIPYYLVQTTLIITFWVTWHVFAHFNFLTVFAFEHLFIMDCLSVYLKLFIYLSVFFTFIYAREYNNERKISATEFYALGFLSLLGMMILVSSCNLLILFLGLELFSLPTYAMVAMGHRKTRCVEASMKYFIIGAITSGILLYGMSMIFGATKSLDFIQIARIISSGTPLHQNLALIVGLVFITVGVAFKLGAAPFHMWVPDVYEGAPSSVTLFISTAPKIATYAMLIRLFVGAMPALQVHWHKMLVVIVILSMTIGNFAAIAQSSIKRMLAYSSIAHMGYMLLGVLCGTREGYAAAMFYIITYSLMTIGAFGMIILMSRSGFEAENIKDFAGLSNRNPWLAFMMMLVLFSLAGVPPLVGFIAKVGVLYSLIQIHLVWLAVLAVLLAIVGAYYYIHVIKLMYFEKAPFQLEPIQSSLETKIAISLNGLAVLLIGLFPNYLYTLSHWAF